LKKYINSNKVVFIIILLIIFNCKPQKNESKTFDIPIAKPKKIDTIALLINKIDSISKLRMSIYNSKKRTNKTFNVGKFKCCWYYNSKKDKQISLLGISDLFKDVGIRQLMILERTESCKNFEQNWFDNKLNAKFIDVNFNKKKDFIIQSKSKSETGNIFYNVYTFFDKELKFYYSDKLSGGNFKLNYKTKTASTSWKYGNNKSIHKKFIFRGDGRVHYTETIIKLIKKINTKKYQILKYYKYKYNNLIEKRIDTIEF